jgi:hypothetical protein
MGQARTPPLGNEGVGRVLEAGSSRRQVSRLITIVRGRDVEQVPSGTRNDMNDASNMAIQPRFRTIDGLSVRYAESEPRDADALLLCPWPESVFAFDRMWTRLAERAHLVAIDLPGFGHSQRRDALLSPR